MSNDENRTVTLRRTLQQMLHCVDEALSIVENNEDPRCALDDLEQAEVLLRDNVRPALRRKISEGS